MKVFLYMNSTYLLHCLCRFYFCLKYKNVCEQKWVDFQINVTSTELLLREWGSEVLFLLKLCMDDFLFI